MPLVAGLRVLDAGCGGGRTSALLVEQGAEVVGIDVGDELLRRPLSLMFREIADAGFVSTSSASRSRYRRSASGTRRRGSG